VLKKARRGAILVSVGPCIPKRAAAGLTNNPQELLARLTAFWAYHAFSSRLQFTSHPQTRIMAIQKKKRRRMTPNIARKRQQLARPSHFFRLSAELRNRIYEFALSATRGSLLVEMVRGTSRMSKKPRLTDYDTPEQEFNQIKFVNRQLYAETAGMEVSFNRIVFAAQLGVRSYRPFHRFHHFVKECAPGKWKWLRHMVLVSTFTSKDKDAFGWMYNNRHEVIALINLCIANPHLTQSSGSSGAET